MDRPAPDQLTDRLARRREDALAIARAGIAAVSPGRFLPPALKRLRASHPHVSAWSVLAVGKAATGMYAACAAAPPGPIGDRLVIAPDRPADWPADVPFVLGGHPFATAGSFEGAERALALAAAVPPDGGLLCLLSGGASALMAAPLAGLTLEAKQRAVAHVMTGGADITALNTLRKHLSRVKGGRLAAACAGDVVTLALSDVIGDDLSVIGSGPCVPDASTWTQAAAAVERHGGWDALDAGVRAVIEGGVRGAIADTPKPGAPTLARARAEVVGGRRQAMDGARHEATARGYAVVVVEPPVHGEAREAAAAWWSSATALVSRGGACAIVSSGETTVRVRGRGRGGRNQEFGAALVDVLGAAPGAPVVVSVGTDGIDGPTDAAGALVDAGSHARAGAAGRSVADALADNDCYPFLEAIGDLVRLGPTGTNVGDLQVLLIDPA